MPDDLPDVAGPQPATVRPRQVFVEPDGPVLVAGPVEICVEGRPPLSVDRFLVAVCACGLSNRYPLCDGSHLRRPKSGRRDPK
jgi:CDGSH-type Zn-finger protein